MEWKDIFEGRYSVSNTGLVRLNFRRDRLGRFFQTDKIMSPALRRDGYLRVPLTDNAGVRKHFYVHRLVGEAFIPNPENLATINHKDLNRSNNSVENLEWMSHVDNCEYSQSIAFRLRNPEGEIITANNVSRFCRENNLSPSAIHCVLKGRRKHHKGYTNV